MVSGHRVMRVFGVFRYQMGDFHGDILREISLPLVEKPVYSTPVTLTNGNRHKTEAKIKVVSLHTCDPTPTWVSHCHINTFKSWRDEFLCWFFRCRRSRSLSEKSFPSTCSDQRRRTSDGTDSVLRRDVSLDLPVPTLSTRPTWNSTTSTAREKTTVHRLH